MTTIAVTSDVAAYLFADSELSDHGDSCKYISPVYLNIEDECYRGRLAMIIIIYNAPEGISTHPEAAQEFSEKLSRLMLDFLSKNPSDENTEVEGVATDLPAGYIIVLRKKAKGSQLMSKAEGDLVKAIALLLGEILSKYAKGEYEIEFVSQFH